MSVLRTRRGGTVLRSVYGNGLAGLKRRVGEKAKPTRWSLGTHRVAWLFTNCSAAKSMPPSIRLRKRSC